MKHYKTIVLIHSRISELQKEIKDLKKIDDDMHGYSGYVFVQEDISNLQEEIDDITITFKYLISLNK